MNRRMSGWKKTDTSKRADLHAKSAHSIPTLDPSVFTELTSIDQFTSIEQRFRNLAAQPITSTSAWPVPHRLLGKLSKRCRECQHNLIKPELSAKSTRYVQVPRCSAQCAVPLSAALFVCYSMCLFLVTFLSFH